MWSPYSRSAPCSILKATRCIPVKVTISVFVPFHQPSTSERVSVRCWPTFGFKTTNIPTYRNEKVLLVGGGVGWTSTSEPAPSQFNLSDSITWIYNRNVLCTTLFFVFLSFLIVVVVAFSGFLFLFAIEKPVCSRSVVATPSHMQLAKQRIERARFHPSVNKLQKMFQQRQNQNEKQHGVGPFGASANIILCRGR